MSAIYTKAGFVENTAPEPVALADFLAAPGNATHIALEPNSRLEALEPYLGQLAMITVKFPKFNDGRGYSLAARLRLHYGFTGILRATGEVLTDQIQYFLRQGFNELLVTNEPALDRLKAGVAPAYDVFMQADIIGAEQQAAKGHSYSWRRSAKTNS
jgi:uncharacterized protein (DUF934 family)